MSLFDEMSVFIHVVDAGSFSGAARRLGVAKSVISRRITALETRLDANLFNRTTRRLSLTEVGQAYGVRARRILEDVAEAADATHSLRRELVGRLRVAAPMSFAHQHLSPAIASFLREHPLLDVEVDLNDRQVDLVDEGFDLALRIGTLEDSSLIARKLAPSRRVLCASPAYLKECGEPLTLKDLSARDHRFLVYGNRPLADQWRFRVGSNWQAVSIRTPRLTANNGETLRDAAIEGLGLAILPTFIASAPIVAGELKPVLSSYPLPETSIYAVWAPGRPLSTKVRALVDALGARFGESPYWDEAIR
ncbi:MAG: LysR family transcriptional regulator [Pseudomonas sp.]|jgi:DNA-binding transcriptional LysR family regulator|uniref:LysR family transcriptional regulator n=1 Tax=Pseudomonas sp. TaxID=306 RepID=UPI003C780E81